MGRRKERSPEEQERRAKIRELLPAAAYTFADNGPIS